MQPCPSDFSLDDIEIHGGAASPEVAAHVAACARCRARGVARVAQEEQFRAEMAPALWRAIESRVTARPWWRPWWRRWWALPALATAAVAAVLVVARPGREPVAYVGIKGGTERRDHLPPGRRDGPARGRVASGAGGRAPVPAAGLAAGRALPGDRQRRRQRALRAVLPGAGRRSERAAAAVGRAAAGRHPDRRAPGPERLLVLWSAAPLPAAAVAPVAEAAAEKARADPRRSPA